MYMAQSLQGGRHRVPHLALYFPPTLTWYSTWCTRPRLQPMTPLQGFVYPTEVEGESQRAAPTFDENADGVKMSDCRFNDRPRKRMPCNPL